MIILANRGESIVNEEWRPVVGFEGRYQVSSLGRVRSIDFVEHLERNRTPYERKRRGRLLMPSLRGGYWCVPLGRGNRAPVHHLVAAAFIGPRPEEQVVRHFDGNEDNNALSNLLYGTPIDNEADKDRHGRRPKFERHGRAKLSRQDVVQIRAIGHSQPLKQTGARFGIAGTTVSAILNGRIWRGLPQ